MAAISGVGHIKNQAEEGLKLLMKEQQEEQLEIDMDAATTYKSEVDSQIGEINEMVKTLSGKENKKLRTEKSKEAAALGNSDEYIDAVRISKGQSPKHGNFVKNGNCFSMSPKSSSGKSPKAAEIIKPAGLDMPESPKDNKAGKENKKEQSAGISKAERDELEKLKQSIVDLKVELKAQGMTGGQMNKEERVVAMVSRMNSIKEKETPGCTSPKSPSSKKKNLTADQVLAVGKLQGEIDEYRQRLVTEFKYTKKEIAADPDMVDMLAELSKASGKQ